MKFTTTLLIFLYVNYIILITGNNMFQYLIVFMPTY